MAHRPLDLSGVPNLIDLLAEAKRLGLRVDLVTRTGEVRITAAWGMVKCNNRRKDGNRALIVLLREGQRRERNNG
jgi:hypothetical protein